jgi:hypothetical protein
MNGGAGQNFSGDGGGGGGGGGGRFGGLGQSNLTGNGVGSGGANFVKSDAITSTILNGNNGATQGGGAGGGAAVSVSNAANFGYSNNAGIGGAGVANNPGGSGTAGRVIFRYAGTQRATGGTISSVGGFTIHTFTSNGTFTLNP